MGYALSVILCFRRMIQSRTDARFEELVFAGVGEPLMRWPVVKEVCVKRDSAVGLSVCCTT